MDSSGLFLSIIDKNSKNLKFLTKNLLWMNYQYTLFYQVVGMLIRIMQCKFLTLTLFVELVDLEMLEGYKTN